MPWRGHPDPYGIWISEVMLQQTRVETVRDRWPRFLARFPSVHHLAEASEHAVLSEWEGLGYYSRARNLRRAAQQLVQQHAGVLPANVDALLRLPGFGAYTAAAVASIAFRRPVAVLDGNVIRVLARWSGEEGDVSRGATRRRLSNLAQTLLAPRRPGDWNQAVMDLGAVVCTPRSPRCAGCPLRRECRAFADGDPQRLPNKPKRGPTPHHDIAAGLVWRSDRVLIGRRPSQGLLGGLWEFPGGKRQPGEALDAACAREIREETGLRARVVRPFRQIDHAYTHFRITLHLFHCTAPRGTPRPLGCEAPRFVSVAELDDYPFPRANRRAIESLVAEGPPRLS